MRGAAEIRLTGAEICIVVVGGAGAIFINFNSFLCGVAAGTEAIFPHFDEDGRPSFEAHVVVSNDFNEL